MGYNMEVSFNIFKNKNVSELECFLISLAKEYRSSLSYSTIEMDNTTFMQRNHSVITSIFKEENIKDLIEYIKTIRKIKGIYIESIYHEDTNELIYASQYYLTIMDKILSKNYQLNKRKRSYSEDETTMMDELNRNKK